MRERVRGSGRCMGNEAGSLTLDWGSNGADYNALDFSYVVKNRMGNLSTIYGQVRRNTEDLTYSTYDTKAGRKREITTGSETIGVAIRKRLKDSAGVDVVNLDVESKMPLSPNTIRLEMQKIILDAVKGWDFCWRGESKGWSEEQRQKAREVFARETWDCGKFYCKPLEDKKGYKPLGLLNVDVRLNRNLYRLWRESCEAIEKV